jgi:hypothetical protein
LRCFAVQEIFRKEARMRHVYTFVLTVLLTVSSLPAWAGAPVSTCDLLPSAAPSQEAQEITEKATVTGIDRKHGVLVADMAAGRVQLLVPPAVVQKLHPGDPLTVCLVDEDPRQNLLQDSILT